MIISKSYAEKLLRTNKAEIITGVVVDGKHFICIKNVTANRTDHYEVTESQFSLKIRLFNPEMFSNIREDLKQQCE
jgi:hypothetical protein